MKNIIDSNTELNKDTISTLAYLLWENAGRPPELELEFWLRAERQLLAANKPAVAESTATSTRPRSRSQIFSTPPKSRKKSGRF